MIYDAHCHLDLMDNMLEFINEIQNSDMNLFAVELHRRHIVEKYNFARMLEIFMLVYGCIRN